MRVTASVAAAAMLAMPALAAAAVIDFETGFVDNEALTPTSFVAEGVVFSTINPDDPALTLEVEAVGPNDPDPQGFLRDVTGLRDEVVPGRAARIGNFFLRTGPPIEDRDFAGEPVFRISYLDAPVSFIRGEIWDIDGNPGQGSEQWRIDAFDAGGGQLGSVLSPLGTTNDAASLDGDVWTFSFDDATVGGDISAVARLDFIFTGSKTTGLGLAFDNFVTGTAPIPLPATLPLLLAALGGVGLVARRRRAQHQVTVSQSQSTAA